MNDNNRNYTVQLNCHPIVTSEQAEVHNWQFIE